MQQLNKQNYLCVCVELNQSQQTGIFLYDMLNGQLVDYQQATHQQQVFDVQIIKKSTSVSQQPTVASMGYSTFNTTFNDAVENMPSNLSKVSLGQPVTRKS